MTDGPQLPTLTELEALKAQYLAQGYSLFDDLLMIIRELGEPIDHQGCTYYHFQEGMIDAWCAEYMGTYLVAEHGSSMTRMVSIHVGGDVVCHLVLTNDPNNQDANQNIYVPGKWEEKILFRLAAAQDKVKVRDMEIDLAKRAKLANQLLIGKVV